MSFGQVLGINPSRDDRQKGFAENNNTVITWCYGHLVTLSLPDEMDPKYRFWRAEHLPILPEVYAYKVIQEPGTQKQFETICSLFHREDIHSIYSCTDSGREGEYIFRLVYEISKCQKPVRRVWISSHTHESIQNGIKTAKELSHYDALSTSAYCRAKEDWLFGMNFSRIYTIYFGEKLKAFLGLEKRPVVAIGRVMTCVLGLVVEREETIMHFVPKKQYGILAHFLSNEAQVQYTGKWSPHKDEAGDDAYFTTQDEALQKIASLAEKSAKIEKIEAKTKKEPPPLLFNLAELQSEANKKYKIPVHTTLEIAQSLYEKKLITYPRTDCRVLPKSMVPEFSKILNGIGKQSAFSKFVQDIHQTKGYRVSSTTKRYVDDSKVTDHYAIIPTYITPSDKALPQQAQKVYHLIVKRFLAIFHEQATFQTMKVITQIENESFITTQKVLVEPGWKTVYEVSKKSDDESTDLPLHLLNKKDTISVRELRLDEKETKPPSRYTDGSLVLTMEKAGKLIEDEELRDQIKTCGIGTSATRASIIKKLIDIAYLHIHPKTQVITPTKKGFAIVKIIQSTAKELLNPTLSASWEKGLVMIEKEQTTEEIFNQKLKNYILNTIKKVKKTGYSIDLERLFSHNND